VIKTVIFVEDNMILIAMSQSNRRDFSNILLYMFIIPYLEAEFRIGFKVINTYFHIKWYSIAETMVTVVQTPTVT
jgi:hypothetical protein